MISEVVPDAAEEEREEIRRLREEIEKEEAANASPQPQVAPAPTGGRPPIIAAYYFTVNQGTEEDPIYVTMVREVTVPGDAIVECHGNTLVIHHPGIQDTFRIGRVRPA